MATSTTNLGLIKPDGTDKIRIAQINQNMDTLDSKIGAVGNTDLQSQVSANNAAISTLNDKISHIDQDTNITDLGNIPINTQGRIKLDGSLRPTTETGLYNYECIGNVAYRTLTVSSVVSNNKWIKSYNNGTWSGWQQLTTGSVSFTDLGALTFPFTLNIPSNSRNILFINGPYSNRGVGMVMIPCNTSGAAYPKEIGGSAFSFSSTTNKVTINDATAGATTALVICLTCMGSAVSVATS